MISEDFGNELKRVCGNIILSEPMSKHTSFKVGGNAFIAAFPNNEDELFNTVSFCKKTKHIVIGSGSNVVFSDKGYDGVVIFTEKINFCKIDKKGEDVFITAGAGLSLPSAAAFAKKNSLSGLEFACGIPGSVGGAVYMNAGAYGGEIKDVLYAVKCVDDREYHTIDKSLFSYRSSPYMKNNRVISSVLFKMQSGDTKEIALRMRTFLKSRRDKQPLEYPSAGSAFKRPEGYFAGKLIEDAGLKGYFVGGAQVSEKHAGFIINKGNATSSDIKHLTEYIQTLVEDKFGVLLESEIRFVD